jgi:Rrf2 family protein
MKFARKEYMQLKAQTGYAIRFLLYLSGKGHSTRKELVNELGINENFLTKIASYLWSKRWITSFAGGIGGFQLAERPENITLFEVLEVMEGTMKINHDLEESGYKKGRDKEDFCPVDQFYAGFQELTERYFSSITLKDLLESENCP